MFCCSAQRVCARPLGRELLATWQKTLRCPSHSSVSSLRTSCASPAGTKPANASGTRWDLVVSPFCAVRARLGCSISVLPLDPHAFPEANRALVAVHGAAGLHDIKVTYNGGTAELSIVSDGDGGDVSVELAAPIKSNLYLATRGEGSVHVQKMECDVCKVETEKGSCVLHSVKAHQVEVLSHGGNVTGMGTIHGNVDISTSGDGAVEVKKLQGTVMNVSTEEGTLKVKAIYAESTSVCSSSGRVELGHVHGNATVRNVSGDIIVDGSNGYLKVSSSSGDIDAYVGDSGSAELHSEKGAVCVRVPSSIRAGLQLLGASVEISPEVSLYQAEHNTVEGQTQVTGYVNGNPQTAQRIKAHAAQGSIRLKTQSWFESLKLGS